MAGTGIDDVGDVVSSSVVDHVPHDLLCHRRGRPLVDVLIDWFLLGLAFVAGQKARTVLAVGFALEMLSIGLATCATCRRYGWSVVRRVAGRGSRGERNAHRLVGRRDHRAQA